MRLLMAGVDPRSATRSERGPARPGRRRGWRRRLLSLGIAAAVLAPLGGGGFAAHRLGWDMRALETLSSQALALSAKTGLAIADIEVEGRHRTSAESILAALGVGRGTPILALSPARAKARLETIPWVRSAAVERRLPDTLYVRIVERRPLALWQHNGKFELVDREGAVLPVPRLDEFAGLVVLVGEDAPKEGAGLVEMLASEAELAHRVAAAVRVGGRRWNLHLDNGIDIQLPEENPTAAWHELARLDRTDGLLEREVRRVDFRLPDRLVVQTPPAKTPSAKKKKTPAGKNT